MRFQIISNAKREYGQSLDLLMGGGSIISDFPSIHYVLGIENIDEILNGSKYSDLKLDMMMESRENGMVITVVRSMKSNIEFGILNNLVSEVIANPNSTITIRDENLKSDILSRGGFGLVGLVAGAIGKSVAGNKSIQKRGTIYSFKIGAEDSKNSFQLCAEEMNVRKVDKFLSNHYRSKFKMPNS